MTAMPRLVVRDEAGMLRVYDFAGPATTHAPAVPVASFPVAPADSGAGIRPAVAPDLSRVVYATVDTVACVDRRGEMLWRIDLASTGPRQASGLFTPDGPFGPGRAVATSCAFSLDGGVVWICGAVAGTDRDDGVGQWFVVEAGTGSVVARVALDDAEYGGRQVAHPDGVHMLLGVWGERGGERTYRGRLGPEGIDLVSYPWNDRCLVDLSPEGDSFMTVHGDQRDLAFHTYPDGNVTVRVPAEVFGLDDNTDKARLTCDGGFLDSTTAMVALTGELDNDMEWEMHHFVDVRTGRAGGLVERRPGAWFDDRLLPLGDGSWLSIDVDGRFWRSTRWSDSR